MKERSKVVVCALIALIALACGAGDGAEESPVGSITQEQALALLGESSGTLFLDVRSEGEFALSGISGSMNVPHGEVATRVAEIEKASGGGRVVLYCERGGRASRVVDALREGGIDDIVYLEGHMREWNARKLPVERGAP